MPTPINFPNITPDTFQFGIKYNTQISTTSLTGIVQTIELPGARWTGSMTFRDLTLADSAALKAFLMELRGMSGRFYMGDITHTQFDTITGSQPLTIQGSSTVRSLEVTTDTGTFQAGDYVQVGNDTTRELKMVIDVSSPQILHIEPLVRRSDYQSVGLHYSNPQGVFLLDSDEQANWAIRSKALLSDITLSFIEA